MAFYPVEIPWTTKPPMGTPLRAGHWSTDGLIHSVGLNEGAGSIAFDVANNYRGAITAAKWSNLALNWPTNASTESITLRNVSVTNKLSILAVATSSVQPNAYSGHLFSRHPGWFMSGRTSTPAGLRFAINTGTEVSVPIVETVPLNTPYTAAGVYDGEYLRTYYNGDFCNSAPQTGNIVLTGQTCIGKYWNDTVNTWRGLIILCLAYNRALSATEIASLSENPWQIYQPRTVWVPLAASGGTSVTVTDSLTALAESYASVTDIATFVAAAEAIITAGSTADATVQMMEGVLSAAVVAASVTDTAVVVDTVQTGATADATALDTAQMVENAATAAAAEASVTDAIVSGVAENLIASATSLASATDVQLMVDNITIMAASGASISEIYTYLEQLTAAATSGASVTDVLVTQFVGRYLFVVTVPPREFITTVSPRSYLTTVGPR